MLSGIGILQWKIFWEEKKIKNEEVQSILKFGNFCEYLRFLENFWLLDICIFIGWSEAKGDFWIWPYLAKNDF